MEIKKSSKASLEKGQSLAFLMGMVIGLAILFVGFEWGTKEEQVVTQSGIVDILAEEEIEITTQQMEANAPPPPPPPVQQQEVVAEVLTIVEDNVDVGNQTLMSSEDTQREAQTQTYVPPAVVVAAVVVEEEVSEQHIFEIVEDQAEFPGGMAALTAFLNANIKYPPIAQENGLSGRVTVQFVINQDGSIVDAEVIRGVDPSLDREALRVVNSMPKWTPGKQRGKPVRVRYTLPVQFRLQN